MPWKFQNASQEGSLYFMKVTTPTASQNAYQSRAQGSKSGCIQNGDMSLSPSFKPQLIKQDHPTASSSPDHTGDLSI